MLFVTNLETTIIANNIFNRTKQVTKWSFSTSNIMPMNTQGHIQYFQDDNKHRRCAHENEHIRKPQHDELCMNPS